MTTETKRDLQADLALCEESTEHVPNATKLTYSWDGDEYRIYTDSGTELAADIPYAAFAEFVAESRVGWPEAIRRAIAAEAEVERLRAVLGYIYQKARNDCAMWDGKMCVGLPVFQDRVYARRLVRDLGPILFPEVSADATN